MLLVRRLAQDRDSPVYLTPPLMEFPLECCNVGGGQKNYGYAVPYQTVERL